MKKITSISLISFLLLVAVSAGFSQLRSPSEYNRDGINLDNTYFTLNESDQAVYGYASQWTQTTARTYEDKDAFFKWYFKDGSTAYIRQGEYVGDIGMITKYLLTDESENLFDDQGKAVQPMTLSNYPIKVELWMGAPEEHAGFDQEILVDAVCNDQNDIQYGNLYYFFPCQR